MAIINYFSYCWIRHISDFDDFKTLELKRCFNAVKKGTYDKSLERAPLLEPGMQLIIEHLFDIYDHEAAYCPYNVLCPGHP